jgi:hypothetical protein
MACRAGEAEIAVLPLCAQAVRNTGSAKLGVPWTLEAYSAGLKACTAAWNWGSPKPVVTSGKASGPVTQVRANVHGQLFMCLAGARNPKVLGWMHCGPGVNCAVHLI